MSGLNINLVGISDLEKRFKNAPNFMSEKIKSIIDDTLINIQNKAKQDVPVGKTSKLKNSITHRLFNFETGGFVSAGNTSVKYAPYVEFGTGEKFKIPSYSNLNLSELDEYAATFKRTKKVNLPYRPYLFPALATYYNSMVSRIKKATTEI